MADTKTSATKGKVFSDDERDAMKERAKEVKAAATIQSIFFELEFARCRPDFPQTPDNRFALSLCQLVFLFNLNWHRWVFDL